MIIAIDFDDTITEPAEFPIMGKIRSEAVEVIKELKKNNTLILWTCRTGEYLTEAVEELKKLGVEFDYVNEYPGCGNKVYADIYIDDRAWGAEINWQKIKEQLIV